MDSGGFLDVIPIILNYLDFKSLIQLSKTCHFWRQRIYNDLKLWPNIIELPYIGHIEDDGYRRYDSESVIEAKLWSMILPPEDPKALEKVLENMASSEESLQRFQAVEKVQWKNYIHTDESLRLTSLLFPSIKQMSFEGDLLTIIGIEYIAKSCQKLKHMEFYKCGNLNMKNVFRLFNTEEHKMNLERIFLHNDTIRYDKQFSTEDYLPFMALCQRCHFEYDGYGHSCSSFSCCGSNTPRYPSTLGCQYTHHTTLPESSTMNSFRIHELHDGHPEYMFEIFDDRMFSFRFTARRQLDQCYEKWDKKQQREEKE